LRVHTLTEPGLLLAPAQALGQEDLVDPAPLDRDALVLVEVGLQPIEGPAAEVEAQVLRVGQRGGDDLGDLLGGVGRRAALAGPVPEPVDPPVVEAAEPEIELIAAQPGLPGDLAGPLASGQSVDDLGPLDQAGLVGARPRESRDGRAFLVGQLTESDLDGHGAPPVEDAPHPTSGLLPDAPLRPKTSVI
jgi:hypothetical protein